MKTLQKKLSLLSFVLMFTTILQAQPHCFLVGPAFSIGSSKISNYSFTRTNILANDGTPSNVFTNMKDAKASQMSAGIYTDMYFKHTRFSMDFMFPIHSYTNFFNMNLAFGGYIKGKVGILAGLSVYSNTKEYLALPSDATITRLALTADPTSSANYYSTAAPKTMAGVNALLTYAIKENFVLRVDYGLYAGSIANKNANLPDGYNWGKPGKSRKIELGAVWQFSDNFGLAIKYVMWNTIGNYTADIKYDQVTPSGNVSQNVKINMIPERQIKSNVLTLCIMIPLGSAESSGGTIELVK